MGEKLIVSIDGESLEETIKALKDLIAGVEEKMQKIEEESEK